jgi:SAM-dependent methyltransferase
MFGDQALDLLIEKYEFFQVLDIGFGQGEQTKWLREKNKKVVTIDLDTGYKTKPDIIADYNSYDFTDKFDLIWCSHVLEHQLNVNFFLRKIWHDLKPRGIYAITVPPMKPHVVGGHVTVWNAGLLLYNLVLAGFDCSKCHVKRYGYNISVVGRKKKAKLPKGLKMDQGDIEKLARFFPLPVQQDFNGDIQKLNWDI